MLAQIQPRRFFFRLDALIGSGALEGDGDVLGWDDGGRRKPATVRKPA